MSFGFDPRPRCHQPERRNALLWCLALAALTLLLLLAAPPAGAQTTDYDGDDDGLIDVRTPAQLSAIRYDVDGNGDATDTEYADAFPGRDTNAATLMGCPAPDGCSGYELLNDLDLSGYNPWTPIAVNYAAVFDGRGHAISGMTVRITSNSHGGLFQNLTSGGVLRNVGVINPNVHDTSGFSVGGLVGRINAGGIVERSYVSGGRIATASNNTNIGGLAGYNRGAIRVSYSTAAVVLEGTRGDVSSGGLVGWQRFGTITTSYAAGPVVGSGGSGTDFGGLVGYHTEASARVLDSYCDRSASGRADCVGLAGGSAGAVDAPALNTGELRRPGGYSGIYEDWNFDLDGDPMTDDDPWDFGGSRDYPLLKFDANGDGKATWQEFGQQYRYEAPPPPYNWQADHPESYANARYGITASCEVVTTGTGDDAVNTSTLTFNLADYDRPITLALSLWDKTHFRSLPSLGHNMPALQRQGQTATVEVVTDPARTRFRLDGQYGLNLVLGYADCHTDDP